MRTVKRDLAGQVSVCIDRLHALSSMRGIARCRQRGKVLCVQQHPYVWVISSLAFESPLEILQGEILSGVVPVWIPVELTCFSSTPQLLCCKSNWIKSFWPKNLSCSFCSVAVPKTPAIQHAKIENEHSMSCEISRQFQT